MSVMTWEIHQPRKHQSSVLPALWEGYIPVRRRFPLQKASVLMWKMFPSHSLIMTHDTVGAFMGPGEWLQMDSSHKGPVIQKVLPCHSLIMTHDAVGAFRGAGEWSLAMHHESCDGVWWILEGRQSSARNTDARTVHRGRLYSAYYHFL